MKIIIKYVFVKNWRIRVDKSWNLLLTIPWFMRFSSKYKDELIERWKKLLTKRSKQTIQYIWKDFVIIFWKQVSNNISWQNLDNYLSEKLISYITPVLEDISQKIWYNYSKISIKKLSSKRWSCSFNQNISLNLRLVHLEKELINYVVIHELCHLKEKNHWKEFWKLVERYCPNYKIYRKKLKMIVI